MKIGLVIYGSLDTLSGGYLYDRKLVEYLRAQGDSVEIISLPWRNYAAHLTDNFWFRLWKTRQHPQGKRTVELQRFDILIQDELNHPSLIAANRGKHPYPIISLVHHLRCSELRPKWQNDLYRVVEKKYLRSVDGFIFNSQTTKGVVNSLLVNSKPEVVAYPPTDRFGEAISEEEIKSRASKDPLQILFLGNVMGRKGLHTLLEAVKGLKSKVRVDVIGSLTTEPNYAKRMQEFVTVNGLHLHRTAFGAVQVSSIVTFHSSKLTYSSSHPAMKALGSFISKAWHSVCQQSAQRLGQRVKLSSMKKLAILLSQTTQQHLQLISLNLRLIKICSPNFPSTRASAIFNNLHGMRRLVKSAHFCKA
jgi:glycosyltransferase involved in cell wall biosynthesis